LKEQSPMLLESLMEQGCALIGLFDLMHHFAHHISVR